MIQKTNRQTKEKSDFSVISHYYITVIFLSNEI